MTADISRIFGDKDKFFRNVVRQQGRLPTDAEENHASTISLFNHETSFFETISPLGTPNDGFKIAISDGSVDSIDIAMGSYYLAGARIENDQDDLTYAGQASGNWLTLDEDIVPDSRIFCWLEAEERTITAIEDNELFEPAIGGADGAARTRICWRVRQAVTSADSCSEAMETVLAIEGLDSFHDPETGIIQSDGALSVGFDPDDIDLDLCKPAVEPGYLGNRNNCYRVKISRDGRFVWGEDNASHLYRVTAADDGTITFLNEPRDEYLRPKAGQTIELLRGDVLLPNGETVAEPDGSFYSINSGYVDGEITVTPDADLLTHIAWLNALPDSSGNHFYARIWTGVGTGSDPDTVYTAGNAITLTGTGLTLTFSDSQIPGDSWVVAARPDAPTRLLPWSLQDTEGMMAHARRRHVAPLAIADLTAGTVKDCRDRFRPLHKIQSCCTVTVGDGEQSHGDVDDIEEAVALLPDEGGEICLLRGVHRKSLTISGRRNIRFSTCKGMSEWLPDDDPDKADDPILTLSETNDISFSNIVMKSGETPCIAFQGLEAGPEILELKDLPHGGLAFDNCCLSGTGQLVAQIRGANDVAISDCEIVAKSLPDALSDGETKGMPALFVSGFGLNVERSEISAGFVEGVDNPSQRPLGGIQIGGGSEKIRITDCVIQDGCGIGITLGSVFQTTVPADDLEANREQVLEQAFAEYFGTAGPAGTADMQTAAVFFLIMVTLAGCFGIEPVPPETPNDDGTVTVTLSEGEVRDVFISHNRIENMGQSGIASYPLGTSVGIFSGASDDAVAIAEVIVADNHITGCLWDERPDITPIESLFTGFGGISIGVGEDCAFRDNHVMDNGIGANSAGKATSGISIIYGEDIRIEDNRIDGNGEYSASSVAVGPNAGICAKLVVGGLAGVAEDPDDGPVRTGDRPALSVHGNIVYAPAGRALRTMAIGPVIVNDNRLTGANPARILSGFGDNIGQIGSAGTTIRKSPDQSIYVIIDTLLDLIGGDAVHITNLGIAEDLFILFSILRIKDLQNAGQDLDSFCFHRETPESGNDEDFTSFIIDFAINAVVQSILPPLFQRGGETMFTNNQVSLRKSGRNRGSGGVGSISSIFIASLDDIKFSDNQYEVEINRFFSVFNALLVGTTIRSIGNRGQEGVICWRSLFSVGILRNTTGLNQTTTPVYGSVLSFGSTPLGINRIGVNT